MFSLICTYIYQKKKKKGGGGGEGLFSFCQLPAELKFLKISLSIRRVLTCHVSFQRTPASVTPSATEVQSPCVSQRSGPGWGGGSSCRAEHSPAHAWAGPGSELSLWGSLGTPQGVRQLPLLPNTASRPKSPSREKSRQGPAFPCAGGDGACECLKLELLR